MPVLLPVLRIVVLNVTDFGAERPGMHLSSRSPQYWTV